MTEAACAHLHSWDDLEDSLADFSSYERMSTDIMQLIRGSAKEFHHEGDTATSPGVAPVQHRQ